jgi:hypothetical protein
LFLLVIEFTHRYFGCMPTPTTGLVPRRLPTRAYEWPSGLGWMHEVEHDGLSDRRSTSLVWDPYHLNAPPEHSPALGILAQLQRIRERMEADPDWRPPTFDQIEDGKRVFEDAIERIRGSGSNFPAHVEAELAAGTSLGEIGAMERKLVWKRKGPLGCDGG